MPSLITRVFSPIRFIVNRLLAHFPAHTLDDPAARENIIRLAEIALINEFPASRALPRSLRFRIIGKVLDTVIGTPRPKDIVAAAAVADPLAFLNLTEDELATLENGAPGNSVNGFIADGRSNDQADIQAAVLKILGFGWTAMPTEPGGVTFKIHHPDEILSVSQAWEKAHKLEEEDSVEIAEPSIEWVPAPVEIGGSSPDLATIASFGGGEPLACAAPKTWNSDVINITSAWELSPLGRKKGAGVKVGHLDTGLTSHRDMPLENNPHILLSEGINVYDPKHKRVGNRPLDPMDSGLDDYLRTQFKAQDGHGTQTLSVLLCQSGEIRGTAPLAKVVPFRISPTVVNFNVGRIAEGIRRAHAVGCDVITMSMGGPEPRSKELRRVIQRAVNDGVIICTAAGNQIGSNDITPIVVWPAAYDEVIAVGGSNCRDKVWSGSSRGREINTTAPAESVWRLSAKRGALPGTGEHGEAIAQGDGTSYATPTTAGVAACWLAHHGGRAALVAHYGGVAKYVPLAFAYLLRTVAYRRPSGWNTRLMGPGILDAEQLLRAVLPEESVLMAGWPVKEHTLSSSAIAAVFKGLGFLFGPSAATTFAVSTGTPPPSAQDLAARYGTELAQLLMDRPALLKQIADSGILLDDPASNSLNLTASTGTNLSGIKNVISTLRSLASASLASVLPQQKFDVSQPNLNLVNSLIFETANGPVESGPDVEMFDIAAALADREAEITAQELLETGPIAPEPTADVTASAPPPSDLIGSQLGQISEEGYQLIVQFETGGRNYYETVYRSAPCWPGYSSGITIGFGFDLGYYTPDDYQEAWEAHLSNSHYGRLKTAIGFRTDAPENSSQRAEQVQKAKRLVSQFSDIPVPWGTAETVFINFNLPKQVALTRRHLPEAATLPADCAGALVSLVFNRGASFSKAGARYAEMRRIKAHLAGGMPELVPAQLRSMKRLWPTSTGSGGLQARREMEAQLFERGLAAAGPSSVAGLNTATALTAAGLGQPAEDSSELTVPVSDLPTNNPENDWRIEEAKGEISALSRLDLLADTRPLDYRNVYWAPDEEQPDYRHLDNSQTGVFEFTAEHLELLLRANSFQPHQGQDNVLFGLRGCLLRGGVASMEDMSALKLEDARPDHRNFRCLIGVYHRGSRKLSAFMGSTVPNRYGVYVQYRANPGSNNLLETKANMVPCGMQPHVVGTHGGHTPGAFLQGTSDSNRLRVVVLRSQNNLGYDVRDIWHDNVPHDNIHPAYSANTAEFSSYGCFTVRGNYQDGHHVGEWAKFRRAAGLTDSGNHNGQRYSFVLLTGLEALLASRLTQKQASESEIKENLFRLRHGSRGDAVRRLQSALGINNSDGDFGPITKMKLADVQRARLGWSDGVFSPEMEQRLAINGVFA